jgi:hypothetical protein
VLNFTLKPSPSHLPFLDHSDNIWQGELLQSSSLCSFL